MVQADIDFSNLVGARIDDRFAVDAMIRDGADGMEGVVYLVEDEVVETDVLLVIKILTLQQADRTEEKLANFNHTCQLVQNLADHENVAKYQHYNSDGALVLNGNEHSVSYMVMEYYRGGTMYDILSCGGAFDHDVGKNIFRQLINGIDHLHNAGVAHCDIKLENVVVKEAGQLRLIDFGHASSNAFDAIRVGT